MSIKTTRQLSSIILMVIRWNGKVMSLNSLKGVNTFRIGAEYKVIPSLLCVPDIIIVALLSRRMLLRLASESINTDTDYANLKSLSNYTLVSVTDSAFYADLATNIQYRK